MRALKSTPDLIATPARIYWPTGIFDWVKKPQSPFSNVHPAHRVVGHGELGRGTRRRCAEFASFIASRA